MIAEDSILKGEMTSPADGTTASRHNRNLSSIVSTIRDDGPSAAENVYPLHTEQPDNSSQADTPESLTGDAAVTAARRQRIRALPGMAVMSKVLAILVLVLFIGGLALLASGRYPVIDDRGLRIAVLPASVIAEMEVVKAGVEDTFAQWLVRAKLLFSENQAHKPEIPAPGAAGLATVAARQQQIMSRLDALAADIDTLRSNFEREQGARLVSSVSQQPEQDLQLKAVQAQLAGLQQQLADDRTAVAASPKPSPTVVSVKQMPAKGDWVVNVASSSQEDSIRQLQVKLKKSGVDTVMQRIGSKGEPRYRLRVTGFATSGEAKRYAAGLAQKSGINGAWASKR